MKNLIKKFNKAVDNTMDVAMRAATDQNTFKNMSKDDFEACKVMLELFDACVELTTKQASMIDDMNEKLNELLEKQRMKEV